MEEPRRQAQVGEVIRIPLPDKRYAFACVLRDACVGIYPGIYSALVIDSDLVQSRFAFVTGIYSDALDSVASEVVAVRTFASENEQWPPPQFVVDFQTRSYSIYYKGRLTPCRPEDVVGLEIAQVCELDHIIDRILEEQEFVR